MRALKLSEKIDDAIRRKEKLREDAERFIREWFNLKRGAFSQARRKLVPRSMFSSNPKLSAFTEEDRLNFRE